MATLGEGGDNLTINDLDVNDGKAKPYGGNGVDHQVKTGAQPTGAYLDQTGCEFIHGRYVINTVGVIGTVGNQAKANA